MSKAPSTASMKSTLEKIANLDFGVPKEALLEMSAKDVLDKVVTLAEKTLKPEQGPSVIELKAVEIHDFILSDFALAFAGNEEICEKLNGAGIKSPTGKEWSKSNVSKIMPMVKELLTKTMNAKNAPSVPAETEVISGDEVTQEVDAIEETNEVRDSADTKVEPEVIVATEAQTENQEDETDALLKELEELELTV